MSDKITCIAIDDEPLALKLIKTYADATENLKLITVFEDAIAALAYLKNHPIDLLFLDINMPDISGIDFFKSLQNKPMVIFTTAYKNYAFEGFELNAVDYLLKPIDYTRFKKAIQKAIEYHHYKYQDQKIEECIFVHSEYRLVKIEVKDILYLESLEDYVKIHLQNGKMVLTLITLKKLLEKLPSLKFKRIHRSYVVAVNNVVAVINRKAQLSNGLLLPISDTYATFVTDWKTS